MIFQLEHIKNYLSDPRIQKVIEILKNDKILFSHPKISDLIINR